MKKDKKTGEWEYQYNASFYMEINTELTSVNEDGELRDIPFVAGHHYGIDTIVDYGTEYSDILFADGRFVPQVEIISLGYCVGLACRIKEEEAKTHPVIGELLQLYTAGSDTKEPMSEK